MSEERLTEAQQADAARTFSSGRALIVGINEYPDDPLYCCTNDAQDVSDLLSFDECNYAVTTLLDDRASRDSIVDELTALFTDSEEERLLFYFAGHGCRTAYGTYLVTPDGTDAEPGVDLPLIGRLLRAAERPGRSIVVVLDCCHAGAMSLRGQPRRAYLREDDIMAAFPSLPGGTAVLAACRHDELAAEDLSRGHGVFTYHLLEGLYGNAANESGHVTAATLYDYVAQCVTVELGQSTVFRGDFAGSLILGTGFEPIERTKLDGATRRDLETRCEDLLTSFQSEIGASFSQRDVWAASGYKYACQLLTPVIAWFERRAAEHPELRRNQAFKRTFAEARAWQARLSEVEGVEFVPSGRVLDFVGSGTFGTVWKIGVGKDESDIKAYKVFHGQDIRTRDKLARFRRGYEAMQRLDHPFIVKVSELTTCPVGFFMDYVDGPNLRDFVGAQEPHEQLSMLLTIAETLAHAHSRGVIHRDVKPENIVMGYDMDMWSPYLTDFDLAWFSTASIVTKEAIGSAFYAAPEQIYKPASSSARDAKVDVYSFGQLSFYALTGSDPVPHAADNIKRLENSLSQWASGDAAFEIMRLYERTTAYAAKERIGSFREICDALHDVTILCSGSPDDSITPDRFVREMVFRIVGMGSQTEIPGHFTSLSGHTGVEIKVKKVADKTIDLSLSLRRSGPLTMPGLDNKTARRKLNVRIEEVLRAFPQATMHSGSSGTYEVHVNAHALPLTLSGVQCCRRLTSRVIEAMERA